MTTFTIQAIDDADNVDATVTENVTGTGVINTADNLFSGLGGGNYTLRFAPPETTGVYSIAPTLTNLSITDTEGAGALNVGTNADATLYVWIGPTGTTPTAQEVKDGTGADATASVAIEQFLGPYNLTLPDTLQGNYRVSVVAQIGSGPLSNVLTESPVEFDTVTVEILNESVFFDEASNFASLFNFTLPDLGPGRYLIYTGNKQLRNVSTSPLSTLAGEDCVTEVQESSNNQTLSLLSVNLPIGASAPTLTIRLAGDADGILVEVIYIGDGDVTETDTRTGAFYSLTDDSDGKMFGALLTSVTEPDVNGNDNLTDFRVPQAVLGGSYTYSSGWENVDTGSATGATWDLSGTFGYKTCIGVKVEIPA